METIKQASVRPSKSLELLSQREITELLNTNAEVLNQFRQCALAVLNTGSEIDDAAEMLAAYRDFNISVEPTSRGLKLRVANAPASAFVDGKMIRGIQEHLFAALRDIVFTHTKLLSRQPPENAEAITDIVFRIARNADALPSNTAPNLTVCWGGHAISREEYDYSKLVGYQLGLRGINIATGCGLGAMKGPMKGATIGHAKQQIANGRYIGISEPGIIASESPNPIVNELMILPDIEKRLEAFVRLAHAIVVFPGGAGTTEEILYLIAIRLHPDNRDIPLPFILTGPECSRAYFDSLDRFVRNTLGEQASRCYQIIIDDPQKVARAVKRGVEQVHRYRRKHQLAYYFDWQTHIHWQLQEPFEPSHANMAALNLNSSQPTEQLAAELRRAFSGIVAGNVKAYGIEQIERHGPYQLNGDPAIMEEMSKLLREFVQQRRMKLSGEYKPCYEIR
ncbi:nucleotide 5'-monophosphate nucleosidase PpnN [Porticoccus sp. W117]|uniref:nucleotide 5'-monophosphate nucleosidase PpnN n=1 Tax=Porticoccus sp. W117 TaxID=3054777 RepID=UPI00259A220B|nr:nucleotide 5'-monophosphate nucleosidase PpnN [Porticoccus sp. W117]MDM3870859.1 nucleotide 5'-monophosphate nucleosidase PpnN [Porticoccus sp. W117]